MNSNNNTWERHIYYFKDFDQILKFHLDIWYLVDGDLESPG